MERTLCDICGKPVDHDIDTINRCPIKLKYKGLKFFDKWECIDVCPRCADNIRTMSNANKSKCPFKIGQVVFLVGRKKYGRIYTITNIFDKYYESLDDGDGNHYFIEINDGVHTYLVKDTDISEEY